MNRALTRRRFLFMRKLLRPLPRSSSPAHLVFDQSTVPGLCCDSGNVSIRLKRVYDKPAKADGRRILVDRIWPRGLTKREARVDEWLKEIGPSAGLRKWFAHDPARWKEFKKRYAAELDDQRNQTEHLARAANRRPVALLFGAKDTKHNNAVALKEYIERHC
jgi:uncharacterized protein YeaO (DUF488 family)